ncbi:MAG: inositol monophosphatase family protein [Pseudomonadaceae bacterium]
MHNQALLNQVITLVEQAGTLLLEEWHRPGGPRGGGSKAAVDDEIEILLRKELLSLLDCDFWGEETGHDLSGDPYCWVVDPHDGTRDFLLGLPGSSVSVGLLHNHVPVLGVVYAPVSADRGQDCLAWVEGMPHLLRNRQPHPVDLSQVTLTDESIVWLSAAAARKPYANASLCAPGRFVPMASVAYRLARAAAGDGVCGVSLAGLGAHDVAGAHALLRGAKGVLLDEHGDLLSYADLDSVCYYCFGGAPSVCEELAARNWREALREAPKASRRYPAVFPEVRKAQRAYGCLAGLIIGDNLGAQVEFQSAESIARRCVDEPLRLAHGGHWNLIAGQPTDDGELALALARSLVEQGGYDPEAAAKAYVGWLQSPPFDIGQTTYNALSGPRRFPQLSVAEACRQSASLESQANGALMRVAPIGIAAAGNPGLAAEWATQDTLLTHPHPVCLKANAVFAAAVAAGVADGSVEEMIASAFACLGADEADSTVRQCITAACEGKRPQEYQRQMGWVLVALQNAFYHLARKDDINTAVVETVMRGGDTDTNACITGALLGAAQGILAINTEHVCIVASCRSHPDTRRPRPSDYWPDDAGALSTALLHLGTVRSSVL